MAHIRERNFAEDVKKFNRIYKLQVADKPTLLIGTDVLARLINFQNILREELDEGNDIQAMVYGNQVSDSEVLTAIADWLTDIQVYCVSEMLKFGLDVEACQQIIMDSNFSKLGENGLPIYDERGKVMKGPGYWKPEPKLLEMIEAKRGDLE